MATWGSFRPRSDRSWRCGTQVAALGDRLRPASGPGSGDWNTKPARWRAGSDQRRRPLQPQTRVRANFPWQTGSPYPATRHHRAGMPRAMRRGKRGRPRVDHLRRGVDQPRGPRRSWAFSSLPCPRPGPASALGATATSRRPAAAGAWNPAGWSGPWQVGRSAAGPPGARRAGVGRGEPPAPPARSAPPSTAGELDFSSRCSSRLWGQPFSDTGSTGCAPYTTACRACRRRRRPSSGHNCNPRDTSRCD